METKKKETPTNKAAIAVAVIGMAACAAAVVATRACVRGQDPEVEPPRRSITVTDSGQATAPKEEPKAYRPVRGDGICDQSEAYSRMLDESGNPVPVLDDKGEPLKAPDGSIVYAENPYYSKYDCHFGDGVCDDRTDKYSDSFGNTVRLLDREEKPIPLPADTSGNPVPLESADPYSPNFAPECALAQCGPREGEGALPEIARPLLSGVELLVPRSPAEVAYMHEHPEEVRPGDNYFVRRVRYTETCNAGPLCSEQAENAFSLAGPIAEVSCSCPNQVSCRPPPPRNVRCEDGRVEEPEQCDPPRGAPRTQGCEEGYVCEACRCIPEPPEPIVCGDGVVEGAEECDPPRGASRSEGCEQGETCVRCHCREERRPVEIPPCPGDVTGSTGGQSVSRRVNSGILGAAGQLRNALGASGQRIDVSTRLLVDAGGRLTLDGASAQCDGADCSGSADVISTARLSISGLTVAAPGEQCRWTIRTRIPAE